jgi:hypothetical protein
VLQGGTIIAYKTVEDLKTVEWYRDTWGIVQSLTDIKNSLEDLNKDNAAKDQTGKVSSPHGL